MGNSARNIGLGYNALYKLNNVGDGYNIGIGWRAGDTITTGKSNIMIGANVQPTAVTASSEINIGNTIYGNIATGSVGIGTSLPSHEFNVLGSANITDDVYVGENFVVEGNFSAKRAYLTVSSNESQEVVIASTAYVMNFSHIEDFFMMGLEGSENITVEDSGDYVLALSGLFVTDSNNKHFNIWVQTTHADGITFANVPRSNTRIEVENAGTDGLIAVTYMLDLNSGDKFRLMYSSDDAGSMLLWTDGSGVGVNAIPETPSMIMTVFKHSEITT